MYCLVACKTAPQVYPQKIPSCFTIVLAASAASLSVTVKGAQTSIPTIENTQLFLKQNPIQIKNIL